MTEISNTISLESMQNDLIRDILAVKNINVLKSFKRALSQMVIDDEENADTVMQKKEILSGLDDAAKDIILMRNNQLKGKPLSVLLNEL